MKNNIFLPKLTHVEIANYSLYNQNLDYDFIDGINLIIGGNGVGKTTFINIIKYALIGLYKKDLIVRNYQGEKRFNRGTYKNCNTYFRSRTNNTINDQKAYVKLSFELNGICFEVKRSLYDTMILSANIKSADETTEIPGELIRQDLYSKLENEDDSKKAPYLQYNYEIAVAKAANMGDFNDFIFFVNQILMFGEDRSNVLWDETVQSRLLSNYLNDVELEKQRKDYTYEVKYQDSIARHKQEEIKAIRKILDKLNVNAPKENSEKRMLELLSDIEKIELLIKSDIEERQLIKKKMQNLQKEISDLSLKINDKEREINQLEASAISEYWPGLNPNYFVYKSQYLANNICPMCNSPVNSQKTFMTESECFFCHSKIADIKQPEVGQLNNELNSMYEKRHGLEIELLNYEEEIDLLDTDLRRKRARAFEFKNELSDIESVNDPNMKKETSYNAMINQVRALTLEKEEAQKRCEELKLKCSNIIQLIENNLLESTKSISNIFKEFAEAFLRLPCKLSLDDSTNSKIKVFVPVIDGKARYDAEELSESQRFFIDYSFRMSILAYFYNLPSFYICETPDSSLDLSYEENAANTLLNYLKNPNSLILTSNLNNSTFIKCLLSKTKKINVLNLLKYGKVSAVQTNHQALQNLSREIEEIINE